MLAQTGLARSSLRVLEIKFTYTRIMIIKSTYPSIMISRVYADLIEPIGPA